MDATAAAPSTTDPVDILIVTAVKDEWDELLKVAEGREGAKAARTRFRAADGSVLRVLVTWALEMGGTGGACWP